MSSGRPDPAALKEEKVMLIIAIKNVVSIISLKKIPHTLAGAKQ